MSDHRIHALPIHLANQIAAGEVIERPASVLKELVENSIDAGATYIDITIEAAGRQLIKVSDNGKGIHPDDLALAISRHATSKLKTSNQLSQINTLGFRGEALPSIASVSKLILSSKQSDQEYGWQYSLDAEQNIPAAQTNGTTISVADLFFNLPARRRFLRSDKTESNHITTTFYRLALSRFDIGFQLQIDNHPPVKFPAVTESQQHERIAKLCGRAFIEKTLYLQQSYDDIHLRGWLNQADAHRAQTDIQYFFINGRVIRDRVINHAIRQAFNEHLPAGRQPAYVLYLTLPTHSVDVNVHPTKHEVRFRDARLIHGLITQAVKEALTQTEPEQQALPEITPTQKVAESAADYRQEPSKNTPPQTTSYNANNSPSYASTSLRLLFQRYVLTNDAEPLLIDLAAAEQFQRQQQFNAAIENNTLTARTILVPLTITLTKQEYALFSSHQPLFAQFAIEFQLHEQTITLKTIPYLLAQVDLKAIISALSNGLKNPNDLTQAMSDSLSSLLPKTPLQSAQHAEKLLQQLDTETLKQYGFVKKLDPNTLAGLFSEK